MRIKNICVYATLLLTCTAAPAHASTYETTIGNWESHNDVADWMKKTWKFSTQDAKRVASKIRREGPQIIPAKSAKETYKNPQGWCKDAANFANETLNKMNPKYKAQYIFIKNRKGPPHHWVTGFRNNGKLYVMDFGAGQHWEGMMGIHGPYNSLDGYRTFLAKVRYRNFELQSLDWWPSPDTQGSAGTNNSAKKRAKVVLGKFDRNNDGKISLREAPKPMKNGFKYLDANGDNYLDEAELISLPPRG